MAADRSQGTIVRGLQPLRSSMRKAGLTAAIELTAGMRVIGQHVRDDAQAGAPVGPRPKRAHSGPLAASLRVSVTQRGVSVYSNEPHAFVQDRGGRVGHGAIITRARASGYMSKAVSSNQVLVTAALDALLDNVERTIHS